MKVREIRPGMKRVDLRVRIIGLSEPTTVTSRDGFVKSLQEAEVGDSTGITVLNLWEERIRSVRVGDVIDVKNGFITTTSRGLLRLNVGRYGQLIKVEDAAFPTEEEIQATR